MLFCMLTFSCMAFSCMSFTFRLHVTVSINQPHGSIIHKNLARAQQIRASRPNRGRVHAHTRPDQVEHSSEPCAMNSWTVRLKTSSRAPVQKCGLGHAYVWNTHSSVNYARNTHSAMHTPEYTHNLAQVTLNILCSTHSNTNNVFCFCLYTSGLNAGLTMWDISQFLFFFLFSSNFILT